MPTTTATHPPRKKRSGIRGERNNDSTFLTNSNPMYNPLRDSKKVALKSFTSVLPAGVKENLNLVEAN